MPSPSLVAEYPPRNGRVVSARRPRVAPGASRIVYGLFVVLTAFSLLNIGGVYTYAFGTDLPVNPLTFAALAVPIFVLTRNPQSRLTYFRMAWIFWLVYTIGGFLGSGGLSMTSADHLYRIGQVVFKLWISLIGLPWLASRVVDEASLPRYVKTVCVFIAFGSVLAIWQMISPGAFSAVTTGGGRAAGVWINPNVGAAVCACGVLFNLMFPFRLIVINLALRLVILGGLAATLSRGGILAAVAALLVYGILLGRWTAVLRTVVITMLLAAIGIAALEPLKQSHIPGLAARAEGIQQMLQGGIRGQTMQGRWGLWRQGFDFAAQNWIRGRGHGTMNFAIKLSYLEHEGRWHRAGPHNYYIFVWGNSGIIALAAFFLFLANLVRISLGSQVRRIRAGLFALLIMFMLLACADHALFSFQFFGAIFAVFALAGHYTRKRTPLRAVGAASAQAGLAVA